MNEIHLRVDSELYARLVQLAKADKRSLNNTVVLLIERGLGAQPKQG